MPRQRFSLSAILLFSFLCCSCSTPDEPSSGVVPTPPQGHDFFPAMEIGDSVRWDYMYLSSSMGAIRDYYEGVLTWQVAARVNGQTGMTTTILQTFRGFKSIFRSPTLRDTVWLAPEETTITVEESAGHQISLHNSVSGASGAMYGGPAITFPRYTESENDTIMVKGGILGSSWQIQLVKGIGLVDYQYGAGAGMGANVVTIHRR